MDAAFYIKIEHPNKTCLCQIFTPVAQADFQLNMAFNYTMK